MPKSSAKVKVLAAVLATLLLVFPVFSASQGAAANTDLVSKGRAFADELFGPMFKFLEPFGFGANNAGTLIQFFAAFTLLFFLIKEMNPGTSDIAAFMATVLGAGIINMVFRLDWYTFLVHFSPSLLVFFFLQDILSRFSFMFRSSAKWISLFGMILVFYTDYALFKDNGVFGYLFGQLFGEGYSFFLDPWGLIGLALMFTFIRVTGLISKVMNTETAMEYRRQVQRAVNIIPQKIVEGGLKEMATEKK